MTTAVSPAKGGTTTPAIGDLDYDAKTIVNITATNEAGYRLVNWTGDMANPNDASTTVTMNGNKTVTVNFKKLK